MDASLKKNVTARNKETPPSSASKFSRSLPPPPPDEAPDSPPPPPSSSLGEFHLPETNFFKGIRRQLATLERQAIFKSDLEPILAVLIALVLGAFFGFVVSLAVNKAISAGLGNAKWLLPVFIGPLFEEAIKALCILAVAFALPRVLPDRRYSALIGAITGLGFGVLATTVTMMAGEAQGFNAFARLVATPLTQPLFSAFMGLGIFVFLRRRSDEPSGLSLILGLPALFFLLAFVSHLLANTIDFVAPGGVGALVAAIIICPLFAVLLRDFLGGHFNIFHFLEPIDEKSDSPPPPLEQPPP